MCLQYLSAASTVWRIASGNAVRMISSNAVLRSGNSGIQKKRTLSEKEALGRLRRVMPSLPKYLICTLCACSLTATLVL